MKANIDIQRGVDGAGFPNDREITRWVNYALEKQLPETTEVALSIRLVDKSESAALNSRFRGKEGPTNVLSFPFEMPPGFPEELSDNLLGDILICAPLVTEEAQQQQKSEGAHWAHLIIHGILHLLGYNHETEQQAQEMERHEIRLLSYFNIADPYLQPHQFEQQSSIVN